MQWCLLVKLSTTYQNGSCETLKARQNFKERNYTRVTYFRFRGKYGTSLKVGTLWRPVSAWKK